MFQCGNRTLRPLRELVGWLLVKSTLDEDSYQQNAIPSWWQRRPTPDLATIQSNIYLDAVCCQPLSTSLNQIVSFIAVKGKTSYVGSHKHWWYTVRGPKWSIKISKYVTVVWCSRFYNSHVHVFFWYFFLYYFLNLAAFVKRIHRSVLISTHAPRRYC